MFSWMIAFFLRFQFEYHKTTVKAGPGKFIKS